MPPERPRFSRRWAQSKRQAFRGDGQARRGDHGPRCSISKLSRRYAGSPGTCDPAQHACADACAHAQVKQAAGTQGTRAALRVPTQVPAESWVDSTLSFYLSLGGSFRPRREPRVRRWSLGLLHSHPAHPGLNMAALKRLRHHGAFSRPWQSVSGQDWPGGGVRASGATTGRA
jgi:hypothetical protein